MSLGINPNDPLYDYFQIILKKVPEDQREFLTNVRSNSRNRTTAPSLSMLTRLHKQVTKEIYIISYYII